jgi:hypothetical protein
MFLVGIVQIKKFYNMKNTIKLMLALGLVFTMLLILSSCSNYISNLPKARSVYVLKSTIGNKQPIRVKVVTVSCGNVVYFHKGACTQVSTNDFTEMFKLVGNPSRKPIIGARSWEKNQFTYNEYSYGKSKN